MSTHWEETRLRFCVKLNPTPPRRVREHEGLLTFLPMEAIGEDWTIDLSQSRPYSEVSTGYSFFEEGDILIAKVTPCFENGKAAIAKGLEHAAGFGTTEITVVRSSDRLDTRFLFYALNEDRFKQVGVSEMAGAGGLKRVPDRAIKDFRLAAPGIEDQGQIADYLDRETAEIDAFIRDQQELIRLLIERRTSMIGNAVARGLDSSTPTKQSGHTWIGRIPETWSVQKLGWLTQIRNGSTPSRENPEFWNSGNIPWLSSTVANLPEVTQASNTVTELALNRCHLPLIAAGSVLVGLTGQGRTRGLATRLRFASTINQHLAGVTVRSPLVNSDYVYWLIVSAYAHLRFISDGNGGTKGALTCEELADLRIPLPSLTEQASIAGFLQQSTREIDAALNDAYDSIELSRERRAALISAAVTGKINIHERVRGRRHGDSTRECV